MQLKRTIALFSLVSASIGAPHTSSVASSSARRHCGGHSGRPSSAALAASGGSSSIEYHASSSSTTSSSTSSATDGSSKPSASVALSGTSSSFDVSSMTSSATVLETSSTSSQSSVASSTPTSSQLSTSDGSSLASSSSSSSESIMSATFSTTLSTASSAPLTSTVSTTSSTAVDSTTVAAPVSSTSSVSSTLSDPVSTSTEYPVPTPGVEMPTHTYTGGISAFSTGTPVSIKAPSFENAGSAGSAGAGQRRRGMKRQSTAQIAATAEGWTIQSCGSGVPSDCQYENYDAADGTWAFSGKNGGLIYQDGVNLAAGGSYTFTFYWKVVSSSAGASSSSTANRATQAILLGSSANPDVTSAFVPTLGSATVASGDDWAQQTFTIAKLDCQYARFATAVRPDGSLDFRMFLQGKTASGNTGDFLWYVDAIRVQELSPPSGGTLSYLTNTCKITAPASTTTSATSTYTVTQTYAATATPTDGINALTNPSFESVAITETTDVNGFPLRAKDWTSTGCAGRQCQLYSSGSGSVTCQDGTRCEYWRASTTYSQTIDVTIGATYFLSIWTFLGSIPDSTKSGSSIYNLTVEVPGATPGSGGLILKAENGVVSTGFEQSTRMLDLDANFAQNLCGATTAATTASCQFTISAGFTGTWSATDNLLNYFDNVSFLKVS